MSVAGPGNSNGDVHKSARRSLPRWDGRRRPNTTSASTPMKDMTMSKNKTQRYSETRRVERSIWSGKPTGTVHVTRRFR